MFKFEQLENKLFIERKKVITTISASLIYATEIYDVGVLPTKYMAIQITNTI